MYLCIALSKNIWQKIDTVRFELNERLMVRLNERILLFIVNWTALQIENCKLQIENWTAFFSIKNASFTIWLDSLSSKYDKQQRIDLHPNLHPDAMKLKNAPKDFLQAICVYREFEEIPKIDPRPRIRRLITIILLYLCYSYRRFSKIRRTSLLFVAPLSS